MRTDRNPFRSLEAQFDQLRRQFESMIEGWDGEGYDSSELLYAASGMGVDLEDREDEYVLTADVPGFERDEIDVRLVDDTVHITAERERSSREGSDDRYLRSEREHETMRRSVRLPSAVEAADAEATCHNGVLTITLPKADPEELDGQRIDVRSPDQ
ncbi:hsp20-type chaperone [Halovivax asiaticus JCM 14624]|uniref:Hsp20-type chaperone n=1 Tax=Halovivax asiaticus JCM 14624 TaxID=1227490 RepID=M0BIN3_9EURY|nr:Hsp20/alpha crystallin family protein [Halovivax asiaticus]ELZ10751.1 hsp20-type chaperone [Halovivax asiaticus JCM 14624]